MKFTSASIVLLLAGSASAFTAPFSRPAVKSTTLQSTSTDEATSSSKNAEGTVDPLLIRAARGEKVERTPVWMMRQAGRHIAEYRELCKEYPTFRQRSEIPDVAVEVSLQPWRNYQTDGCILFSDILTPLPGMGCEFQIDEKLGPVMAEPIKTWDDMEKVNITFLFIFSCSVTKISMCIATAQNATGMFFIDLQLLNLFAFFHIKFVIYYFWCNLENSNPPDQTHRSYLSCPICC